MFSSPEPVAVAAFAEAGARPSRLEAVRFHTATGLTNMLLLIQLRWFAVGGQFATIVVVARGFGIDLPIAPMFALLGCLVVFNIASLLRWRNGREVANSELFFALLIDVALLTGQLALSGGATNPFVFLYLLQVILGAVLLDTWSTWTIVAITGACFIGLAQWSPSLALPIDFERGLASPYIQGIVICFALNAALLVTFITRIGRNLRIRDARLADLRQRAAEEEHIVRMGLLASGAAHELGTPLATLAVILGDWRRMPAFKSDPELLQEVTEMQAQVQRCKSIVSGILLSAGEARGESSVETTVVTFLDELIEEWRATRPVNTVEYRNDFGSDLPMVSDTALKQMICNVLDNALEASPDWLRLEAERAGETLLLTVTDAGTGFAPEMLTQFGKSYQSSKGRPGSGLGLFLVVNVARTLGGSVSARNRVGSGNGKASEGSEHGAIVQLALPLAAFTLDGDTESDAHDH